MITIVKYINVEWWSDVIYVHVIHFGHFYSSRRERVFNAYLKVKDTLNHFRYKIRNAKFEWNFISVKGKGLFQQES